VAYHLDWRDTAIVRAALGGWVGTNQVGSGAAHRQLEAQVPITYARCIMQYPAERQESPAGFPRNSRLRMAQSGVWTGSSRYAGRAVHRANTGGSRVPVVTQDKDIR